MHKADTTFQNSHCAQRVDPGRTNGTFSTPYLYAVLLLIPFVLLTGCALVGRTVLTESLVGRTALAGIARKEIALLQRSGLRISRNAVVIADVMKFRSTLAGIRMRRNVIGRPLLYLRNDQAAFAEVLNGNTVRYLRTQQKFQLPGILHTVRGRVNVRVGPGLEYQAFKQLDNDQIVLVEASISGWYKVQLGAEEVGWVAAAMLVAMFTETDE